MTTRKIKRPGYIGSVKVGSRRVWSSPVQGSEADARNYAQGMAKSYTYAGGKSRTGLKVSISVRRK
jgi:hypothetical protein